jgi:hypothetical protein
MSSIVSSSDQVNPWVRREKSRIRQRQPRRDSDNLLYCIFGQLHLGLAAPAAGYSEVLAVHPPFCFGVVGSSTGRTEARRTNPLRPPRAQYMHRIAPAVHIGTAGQALARVEKTSPPAHHSSAAFFFNIRIRQSMVTD